MSDSRTDFTIRGRHIGRRSPPYFVAELGTCHQGNLEKALTFTRAAAKAGADCIKTELFNEKEVFDPSAQKTFSIRGKEYSIPLIDHMRATQLSLDEHRKIKEESERLGLPFMATAHDFERVDFLSDIGAEAVKIASPDIIHFPLIRYAAQSGMALFLDTGGAFEHEVEAAAQVAREAGCERLAINHNPAGHPAPPEGHDLRIIPRLAEILQCPIGLSDHYDGYEMAYAAVAVGACIIEKPITDNRFFEAVEHIWAIDLNDLNEVIATIKAVYTALGNDHRGEPGKRPENPHRVSLVASRDIKPGEHLSLENVEFGKPRLGIGVEHWDKIDGRPVSKAIKKGAFIQWGDF